MPRRRRTSRRSSGPEPALSLRLTADLVSEHAEIIQSFAEGLPIFAGRPIFVSVQPELTAHRGKLLSGQATRGRPVHAASFIRQRRIVLESALVVDCQTLRLILTHELFHFVWVRLGHRVRLEYDSLLRHERLHGVRGELGESSLVRKKLLDDSLRAWRNYACESFCDTAAWLFAGVSECADYTLRPRYRDRRKMWFSTVLRSPFLC